MSLPLLRAVEIYPLERDGERFFCLQDPENYALDQAVLSHPAAFIAVHLDGSLTKKDIQTLFSETFRGYELADADFDKVVAFLDEKGFLLSPRFEKLRNETDSAFLQSPVRPAFFAGRSYPAEQDELQKFIDHFFSREKLDAPDQSRKSRMLIAPHIDFHRGGQAYAHAYHSLRKSQKPETVFIFGVAHYAPPAPFILTRKHFQTPLGTLQTDLEIVEALAQASSWNCWADEIIHRTEHSIEFQAVMLAHLYGEDIKIVPILCGAFTGDEHQDLPASAKNLNHLEPFFDVCRRYITRPGSNAIVIAGADLAHVGKRFGDHFDITEQIINEVKKRDEEDLTKALQVDGAGFYDSVMKDNNQRKVCGRNCIYSALKCVEGLSLKGKHLHYGYAHDPAGGIVSFTSTVFHDLK